MLCGICKRTYTISSECRKRIRFREDIIIYTLLSYKAVSTVTRKSQIITMLENSQLMVKLAQEMLFYCLKHFFQPVLIQAASLAPIWYNGDLPPAPLLEVQDSAEGKCFALWNVNGTGMFIWLILYRMYPKLGQINFFHSPFSSIIIEKTHNAVLHFSITCVAYHLGFTQLPCINLLAMIQSSSLEVCGMQLMNPGNCNLNIK